MLRFRLGDRALRIAVVGVSVVLLQGPVILSTSLSDTVVFEVSQETGSGVLVWLSATLLATHTHGRAAVSNLCPLLKTFTAIDPTIITVYEESALQNFDE